MAIELVHIGFDNFLAVNRIVAIASPKSTIVKRTLKEGENKGLLIDMTHGRRTRAAIFTDSGHIILTALAPETIASRLQASRGGSELEIEPSEKKDEL